MLFRITFNNVCGALESEDGKYWFSRTGSNISYLPMDRGEYVTPFGSSHLIEDVLAWNGYSIKAIIIDCDKGIFGFKAVEPRRWEVIKREGEGREIVGYVFETGEPGSAYRFEPVDKKRKKVWSNSLVRLLKKLKPRGWK